ncbi:MAG: hypothetical protein A2001_13905 [Treponema sp. GWC1_61_84]|nr:MAG: hypothetical protein A2001_13905 [Treponema sp. GWC1_61_84]
MNSFNAFLDRHGFGLLPEDRPPESLKEIELRLKLLENDLGIDPDQKPDDEPPPADEKPEEENA